MELNAEQIIKALECCTSEAGCCGCPHFPSLMGCSRQTMTDALALIKELTEENERWKEEYQTLFEASEEEIERLRAEDTEQNKAIIKALIRMGEIRRETKSDTVRKMQEKIEALFRKDLDYTTISRFDVNKIVKEMLEVNNGKKEN